MELVGPIIEIIKCIGTPICKILKYHRNLAQDLKNLEEILEQLNRQKEDMECTLREELRFGKTPKKEVEGWLQKVEGVDSEIRRLVEEGVDSEIPKGKCFSRARLGTKVEKKSKEVKELSDKGRSFNSLVVDAPTRGVALSTTTLVGETTALDQIWNYLIGDEVRKIGVCGMGGVGKTTIIKHVNDKLLNEAQKFSKVIWVTVSQPLNLANLQNSIATALNEDLSKEEDAAKRVGKLLSMLKERKEYVLILDDLWEAFTLEDVGIPEPTRESGCKLIITTRSTAVCRSMRCEVVEVKPLSEEEALNLFLDKVGRSVLQVPTLEEIVKLIVEKCAGLPLALVTIASSMTGVIGVHEWKNALNELCNNLKSVNGVEDKIFKQLQFSYDRLQHQVVQHCFLYCALYPEDFKIRKEELIEHWIDEGLIDEMEPRLDMYHRGYAILKKLEDSCLLERGEFEYESGEYVKMHDLVRDMALRITSVSPRFMVKAGMQLKELPSEHEWRDVEKVSLMRNSVTVIPPDMSPECQTLTTLLLWQNPLTMIHESFFAKMVRLEILDLSYTDIEDLPASIFDLKNLTALLLKGCKRLTHVPDLISKLQALKKLVLRDTSITEVPQGMAKLKNLRYLDLHTNTLHEMPAGLLPELSRLQHLKLFRKSKTLKVKGEELAQLRKLETFEGKLGGVHDFNEYVKSLPGQKGPNQYGIHVGTSYFTPSNSKSVSINEASISGDSLLLPTNIQQLDIWRCHDVRSLSDISSLKDATDLRCCVIWGCNGIECVFSLSSSFSYCTTLEVLDLAGLENLRVLIKGGEAAAVSASPPPPATFSHLRNIRVYNCPKIKKLFWPGLLRDLQNLKVIDVGRCDQMEEIIGDDEENHKEEGTDAIITFTLPKFRELRLSGLPELKSICSRRGVMVCDSLQQISVFTCPKLERMPFSLPLLHDGQPSPPPSLQEIWAGPKEWWESVEWDHPNAKNVLLPLCHFPSS